MEVFSVHAFVFTIISSYSKLKKKMLKVYISLVLPFLLLQLQSFKVHEGKVDMRLLSGLDEPNDLRDSIDDDATATEEKEKENHPTW
ncbi:CLUMA_CG010403, isoform A [Clunio marinus]|uniref:CLUMA_CG010403, isoform A n=1 Tax=Clunio marinus TaxID=568069 RepID=A0A1J1IEZ7_9DIPT|nr:CLUMA_CG010403, isoform A [Clunio marinus]